MKKITSKFRRFFSTHNKQRRSARQTVESNYSSLESRKLLAGIQFFQTTGLLRLVGTEGADTARITQVDDQVTVSLDGFDNQVFSAAQIDEVRFLGLAGDDLFINNSSLDSFAFGQDGNDRLIGGEGTDTFSGGNGEDILLGRGARDILFGNGDNDIINGGSGNDRLVGGDGDDLLVASSGNDVLEGDAGDDELRGNTGVNRLVGGDGADLILGGTGVDRVLGGDGDDTVNGGGGNDAIFGQNGNDTLFGEAGDDIVNGGSGNDTLVGGVGNDRLVGAGGIDRAEFDGDSSDYDVTEEGAGFLIDDSRTPDVSGTDTLFTVEELEFDDVTQSPEDSIVQPGEELQRVYVRPIIASNSNGSNTAEFLGNASQQAEILEIIDEIYEQANIDIEFLAPRTVNDTFINVGVGSGVRSSDDLLTIVTNGDAAGLGDPDPNVVDLYFVERVPEFDDQNDNTVNGFAFVGQSGATLHTGDNLVGFAAGREIVARVVAHELAHNLGLFHAPSSDNLLATTSPGTVLTAEQIQIIRDSPISQEI